ncbi:unnamed protein product [Lactuca virosa]|uniref:CUB domain-containing protein n=1 Tax=Lactuca virosa TaxID=75947 RepID=A0AAU9P2M7_9ASTR|nr:unnamed protein product [Lactuca virosa]
MRCITPPSLTCVSCATDAEAIDQKSKSYLHSGSGMKNERICSWVVYVQYFTIVGEYNIIFRTRDSSCFEFESGGVVISTINPTNEFQVHKHYFSLLVIRAL